MCFARVVSIQSYDRDNSSQVNGRQSKMTKLLLGMGNEETQELEETPITKTMFRSLKGSLFHSRTG